MLFRNWFRRLCCAWRRRPAVKDYWAIKDSWFAIDNNQLFCLLGPNGAGKVSVSLCVHCNSSNGEFYRNPWSCQLLGRGTPVIHCS